jgi:DNA-binding NtrC family response regulator
MRARILVVDDDRSMCELLSERLSANDFEVNTCQSALEALEALEEQDFDAVITDLNMDGPSGIEFCRRCKENRPNMPVILMTGFGDMGAAIGAIRAGASDFISKPIEFPILEHALERALGERHLREQVKRLKQSEVPRVESIGALIGTSRAMHVVYDLIRRVAATETTVLLSGESGTGKELVARALHELSGRSSARFVGINCAAVPGELLESELFGHTRGAFTDAKDGRVGLFEQASNGTLLLDEIGEMPLEMQPKLLRVLQERSVRPVGGNVSVPMTARIIAATNRDLEEEVEKRRFREDLFYRLNVVQIYIPPLRARGNDVLLLADHFLTKFAARSRKSIAGYAPEVRRKLLAYDWPGNVRQLENVIERAVALSQRDEIQLQDLPDRIVNFNAGSALRDEVDLEHTLTLDQIERRQIGRALQKYRGNKTRAAKALGVDRRTLYRKLERYGETPAPSITPLRSELEQT